MKEGNTSMNNIPLNLSRKRKDDDKHAYRYGMEVNVAFAPKTR